MHKTRAKFAGLLPPTTVPDFEIVRSPVWKPNNRVSGVADPEADPIFGTVAGQNRIYHYQSNGNEYLRETWDSEMAFESGATPGSADVFAFKCLIKPHAIHGRRLIYSTKGSLKSGGIFVDQIDGKVRIGWYDTVQKREVWIGTNVPVLDPYHWHYLYVRKRFPDTTLGSGCWTDTIFSLTAASTNDVLIVRRFRKAAANVWQRKPWDYNAHATERNFIGFTTDLEYTVADTSGTGLISRNDRTFTGTVGGQVTASAACFSADMIGRYFCPGTGPHQNQACVISTFTSTTVVNVVDPLTGAAVDLSAMVADPGGVYSGVRLVKSEGFNTSEAVDQTSYDLELFGSHLAKDPESGILPFEGEFASFAYGVFNGATPAIFEASGADNALDGTDLFGNVNIYDASATSIDELHVDAGSAFAAVDTQTYALQAETSTVPNERLEVALEAAASSARARPLYWKFLRDPIELGKRRGVRIAFYDPEQGVVSNPGPELVIHPGGDDASNPSGSVSIALSKLPVSRDRGPIQTRVYMTQPNGGIFYLVAEAPYGASALVVSKSEDEIGRGVVLAFDAWPPPECDVLEIVGSQLACGSLRRWVNSDEGRPVDLPDVVVYSKALQPVSFPAGNLIAVADGSRSGVTGLRELNGRLVIAKRDSLHRAALRDGAPVTELVSSKIGAGSGATMAVLDNALVFWGKLGIYAYNGSGTPELVSGKLSGLFRDGGAERGASLRSCAAVHARRGQVVFTLEEDDAEHQSHRVSLELVDGGGVRFSRYEGPNLTALGDHVTDESEVGELVGGTEEGYVVWLDRDDTQLLMLGPTEAVHGASALTVGVGSTTTRIVVTGTLDTKFDGARGAVLRWGAVEAVVLFAEAGALHLDRAVAAAPANLTAATLGKPTRYWETKWLDFGDPEQSKKPRFLDVILTPGSGTLTVRAYQDYSATAKSLLPQPNAADSTLDLSRSFARFDIGHLQGRHLKFRFESADPFEIIQLVARISDADQS